MYSRWLCDGIDTLITSAMMVLIKVLLVVRLKAVIFLVCCLDFIAFSFILKWGKNPLKKTNIFCLGLLMRRKGHSIEGNFCACEKNGLSGSCGNEKTLRNCRPVPGIKRSILGVKFTAFSGMKGRTWTTGLRTH